MNWKNWMMGLIALTSSACMVGTYEEPQAPRKPYSIRAATEARLAGEDAAHERRTGKTRRVASLPVVDTTVMDDGTATTSIASEPAKAPPLPPPPPKPRPAATPLPKPVVAARTASPIAAAPRPAATTTLRTARTATSLRPKTTSRPRKLAARRPAPASAPTEDVLAAVTRPPTWNPRACGQTGPFVGYIAGFPFGDAYNAYHFHRRGATACHGMCLFVVNPEMERGSGRFYAVLITNDRFTRLPVTMCAGSDPTAAGTAIRTIMDGGTEETVSVLKPGEMLAVGKIYGPTTVEVEECVLLNGALRCGKPRLLWQGSFPTQGPNGLGIEITPRAH